LFVKRQTKSNLLQSGVSRQLLCSVLRLYYMLLLQPRKLS